MRFFASGFFHESVSPLGTFQIFSKICGDIRKSRCTTDVNDTSIKIAAGIGKFATGINDTATGGKLSHQFR
jgi:hypothetical protein